MAWPCGYCMVSLKECTCHESYVVWHLSPSACVHVTHGTGKMDHGKWIMDVRGIGK